MVSTAILFFGVFFLAAALTGYLFGAVNSRLYRVLLFTVAISIIIPEDISTYCGIALGVILLVIAIINRRKNNTRGVSDTV